MAGGGAGRGAVRRAVAAGRAGRGGLAEHRGRARTQLPHPARPRAGAVRRARAAPGPADRHPRGRRPRGHGPPVGPRGAHHARLRPPAPGDRARPVRPARSGPALLPPVAAVRPDARPRAPGRPREPGRRRRPAAPGRPRATARRPDLGRPRPSVGLLPRRDHRRGRHRPPQHPLAPGGFAAVRRRSAVLRPRRGARLVPP